MNKDTKKGEKVTCFPPQTFVFLPQLDVDSNKSPNSHCDTLLAPINGQEISQTTFSRMSSNVTLA